MSKRYLDTDELAGEYPFYSRSTWEKMRLRGDGPRYIKTSGRVVYDRDDVEGWLQARKVNSTSETPAAA